MKRGGRLDELLTLLFMVLVIGVIVCYFALGSSNPAYLILGGAAFLLRVAQYIMRFF
jgi:hypothetical protein